MKSSKLQTNSKLQKSISYYLFRERYDAFDYVMSFLCVLTAFVLLFYSFVYFLKPKITYNNTQAIINDISCSDYITGYRFVSVKQSCSILANYTVNGKTYNNYIQYIGRNKYMKGQTITIEYDVNNPSNARVCCGYSTVSTGFLFLGLAIIFGSIGGYTIRNQIKYM